MFEYIFMTTLVVIVLAAGGTFLAWLMFDGCRAWRSRRTRGR